MTQVFAGTLQVEPRDFTLRVDRMVAREHSIGLDCSGRYVEDGSEWGFVTTVYKRPEGYFMSSKQEQVDGADYDQSVYLLRAAASPDGCTVEGFWCEKQAHHDRQVWYFSGCLITLD